MNGISTHLFLPAPWLGDSALGILSPVDFKAEFGLKVSQVWFERVLVLEIAECQGFRKGTEGDELLPEGPGDRKLGSSPDFTTGTIPSSLSGSFSPSVTGGIMLPRSQLSLTPSLAQQHLLRTPCESDTRSDPRNRKAKRADTITSSWNLLPSGR